MNSARNSAKRLGEGMQYLSIEGCCSRTQTIVESDDEPLSEVKKKIELEHLIEEELQAEAAQGASTSY